MMFFIKGAGYINTCRETRDNKFSVYNKSLVVWNVFVYMHIHARIYSKRKFEMYYTFVNLIMVPI